MSNNRCRKCPKGTKNDNYDDSSKRDTTCVGIKCEENHKVVNKVCTACPAGKVKPAGDDASRGNTECTATKCAVDQYVASHLCTACTAGKANREGDDASGNNTFCQAKCKVPVICASAIKSWTGEGCASGYVKEGTTCTITANDNYTCTSPGECKDGQFNTTAVCEKSGW